MNQKHTVYSRGFRRNLLLEGNSLEDPLKATLSLAFAESHSAEHFPSPRCIHTEDSAASRVSSTNSCSRRLLETFKPSSLLPSSNWLLSIEIAFEWQQVASARFFFSRTGL